MRNTKKKAYIFMGTHENKKKNQEQSNIEQNLKREVKENLRNVEFQVNHSNIYSQQSQLNILSSKTKDQF